jgi:hypothetical protein
LNEPPEWQLLQLPSNGAPVLPVGGLELFASQVKMDNIKPTMGNKRERLTVFIGEKG